MNHILLLHTKRKRMLCTVERLVALWLSLGNVDMMRTCNSSFCRLTAAPAAPCICRPCDCASLHHSLIFTRHRLAMSDERPWSSRFSPGHGLARGRSTWKSPKTRQELHEGVLALAPGREALGPIWGERVCASLQLRVLTAGTSHCLTLLSPISGSPASSLAFCSSWCCGKCC